MNDPIVAGGVVDEAQRQTEDARSLVGALDERQFRWRPGDGQWSVGQCLTHLAEATHTFVGRAEPAIAKARDAGLSASEVSRGPWFGRFFLWAMEPPPRFRIKTFNELEPRPELPRDVVLEEFERAQQRLIDAVRKAEGIDLGKVRVPSPPARLLRWSLGQCFDIALAHNRRHLWQARRIVDREDFPKD